MVHSAILENQKPSVRVFSGRKSIENLVFGLKILILDKIFMVIPIKITRIDEFLSKCVIDLQHPFRTGQDHFFNIPFYRHFNSFGKGLKNSFYLVVLVGPFDFDI